MARAASFPPLDLVDADVLERTADQTRRLERLYNLTREQAWDGDAVLKAAIDKHGPPGKNLDPETKAALSRLMTTLMWGELAAWNISADLALRIDDADAKQAASAQVFDEARHFYVLRDYVLALGGAAPLAGLPRKLLMRVINAPTLAKKLVGMQLLFETNAVVIFKRIAETNLCPVLSEVLPFVERDEARHVGLGVIYFPRLAEKLTRLEALSTAAFQTSCVLMLTASGLTLREDFNLMGLEPRIMSRRVVAMQNNVINEMINVHGSAVLKAIMNPTDKKGSAVLNFIHPEDGLENSSKLHQFAHRSLKSAVKAVDRALS